MHIKGSRTLQHQILVHIIAIYFSEGRIFVGQDKHKFEKGNVRASNIHWEFNWSNQWDQRLIKFIRDELLIPPQTYSKKNLNLVNEYDPKKPWKHQGLNGEAVAVEYVYGLDNIENRSNHNLVEARPGFFIEAGASDGELISNTIYLELKYNWTGLLVEPNPAYLKQLIKKRRNAWIFPYCLSPSKTPVVVDFDAIAEYGGIINYFQGVKKAPGDTNHIYISRFLAGVPSWARALKMQCFPLYSVLQALGLPIVDYFSLDIEGAEYQVLKTIPFKHVDIRMFGVEVEHAGKIFNGTEHDIIRLFNNNGYRYVAKTKLDKFFMKTEGETIKETAPIVVQPIIR